MILKNEFLTFFFFEKIDTEKKQALILMSIFIFSQKGRKRFYIEIINKGDIIDLNCIERNLIESMIELLDYHKQKLKIEIIINNIDLNEKPFHYNEYIESIITKSGVENIPSGYFEFDSSLKNFKRKKEV